MNSETINTCLPTRTICDSMFSRFNPKQLCTIECIFLQSYQVYFFMQTLVRTDSISTQNLCNKQPLKNNNNEIKQKGGGGQGPHSGSTFRVLFLAQLPHSSCFVVVVVVMMQILVYSVWAPGRDDGGASRRPAGAATKRRSEEVRDR